MKHGMIKTLLVLAAAYMNTPIFSQDANTAVGTPNGIFEVSNMGAAQYHIQIEVPDGGPLKPDIGIDYNSQSGLGNVGWGCNISGISSITRGTKDIFHDRAARAVLYEDNDAYYLDGKRLVLYSIGENGEGSVGCVYHPEGDPFTDVTIKNGAYGTYFEVTTPDGKVLNYGGTYNTRIIFNSDGIQKVASWNIYSCTNQMGQSIYFLYDISDYYPCISQIIYDLPDGTKNTINFTYTSLGSAAKKFRLKNVEGKIDKLLTNIICKTGNSIFRSYNFTYNKTSDGTAVKFPRLTAINVTGSDGSSLPPVALTWNYMPKFSYHHAEEPHLVASFSSDVQITDKKLMANDMNGDGIDDIIQITIDSKSYQKKSFVNVFQSGRNSLNEIEFFPSQPISVGYDSFHEDMGLSFQKSYHFGEFDGDGFSDLLMPSLVTGTSGSNFFVDVFYGSGGQQTSMQTYSYGILLSQKTNSLPPYAVIDLNNDGISEILVLEQNNPRFSLCHIVSKGQDHSFSSKTGHFNLPSKPQKLLVADFNGDGLQDLLIICSYGYSLYWNCGGFIGETIPSFYTHFSDGNGYVVKGTDIKDMLTIQLGDFNGDGLPDLLLNERDSPKYHFALNKGDGTFAHTNDVQINVFDEGKDEDDDKFTIIVNDFDYDGKSDVFIAHAHYEHHGGLFPWNEYKHTDVRWYRSTGASLSLMKSVQTRNELDAQNGHITMGDIDGDGRPELINYGSNLATTSTVQRTISPRFYNDIVTVGAGKVSSITDGFGNTTRISYASLTNPAVYTKGIGCAYPLIDLQMPLHVVNTVKTPVYTTGGSSSLMTQTYSYEGLKAHIAGRGLLGFAKTTVSNDVMGTTTIKEISGWSEANRFTPTTFVEETTLAGFSGSQKKVTTMSFYGTTGHWFTYPSIVTTTNLDNNTTETSYTYDTYRGVLSQEKTVYDGGTNTNFKQVTYTYGYPKYGGQWLPTKIVRTQKHPDDGQTYSTEQHITYNAATGLPTKIIDNINHTAQKLTTEYEYYPAGGLKSKKVSGAGLNTVTTKYEYDATHRFLTKSYTSPASAVKTYTYDIWGNMLTECDETDASNKLTTTYTYDGWGRLKTKTTPEGLCTNYETGWASGGNKKYYTKETGTAMPPVTIYYDAFGRELLRETKGPQNIDITKTTSYNKMGLVSQVKNVTGKLTLTDKYTYDERGRMLSETLGTGKSATYSYNNRTVTTTTAGRTYTTTTDAWGNIIKSTDPQNEVEYQYFSNGKPSSVTTNGTTVSMTYDVAGNQTSLTDPDAGTSTYTYAADGTLLTQTDGRGVETRFIYDDLGRIESKQVGLNTIHYTYGTIGVEKLRLIEETLDDKTVKYTYDSFGRVLTETRIVGDKGTYTFTHSYNDQNQLSQTIYPGGLTVTYQYDENGYKTQTQAGTAVVYQQTGFNGLVSSSSFMGKLTSTSTHNTRGYLQNLKITSESSVLEQFNTQYEISTGNLLSRQRKGASKETFTYDNLDRLVSVKVGSKETMRMDYADNGNILYKTGIGEYEYNAYDHPHAVTDVEDVGMNFQNSNLSTSFNDFGKIEQITDCAPTPPALPGMIIQPPVPNVMRFEYGPDQERWYSESSIGYGLPLTTIYAGDYEKITGYDNYSGEAYVKEFYYLDGNAIVIKENGEFRNFLAFTDNIGSILSVIDEEGSRVFDASYDAWGRQTVTKNEIGLRRGYTGHEMLDEFGIINMNGRLYDPLLGRFFSPDNYVQAPDNSQSFNRYSYCLNNPLKYTDPSGEYLVIDDLIAGIIGGVINLGVNIWNGNIKGDIWTVIGKGAAALFSGATAGVGALYPEFGGWAWGGAIVGATNAWLGGATGWDIAIGAGIGVASSYVGGVAGQWGAEHIGGAIVNGMNITSPVLQGAVTGVIGGAAGGYASGFTSSLLLTGDLGEASRAGLDGALFGAPIGGISGGVSGYRYAVENNINPWNGKNVLIQKGEYTVYQGIDPNTGEIKYVGITKRDPKLRWNEHLNSGTKRAILKYEPIEIGLTRMQARIIEQNLINQFGMQKYGGILYNRSNSIAPKYWELYNIKKY